MFNWIAAALLLATQAQATTEHSRMVRYFQGKYASQSTAYPILIFDRDEIEWRFARAGAFGENGGIARARIVQQYVHEKTGTEISQSDAGNIETYLVAAKDGANALPILSESVSGRTLLCAVFPPNPNSNRRLESERVLQLLTPGVYQNDFNDIRDPLSYEQLVKLSFSHELSHCLDTVFMPENYNGVSDPSADQVHRSESFAEAMAILLMASEGDANVAKRRSEYRSVYARVFGPFLAKEPSPFNPNRVYGGGIYYLSPSIEAAQRWIDQNGTLAQRGKVSTLKAAAEKIVREQSFVFQVLNLITYSFTDGLAAAEARSRKFEIDFPSFFVKTTEKLLGFYAYTDNVLATFFTGRSGNQMGALKIFSPLELCPYFLKGDSMAVFAKLQSYREDLESEKGSPEDQRLRAQQLSNLLETLQNACPAARTARAGKGSSRP